MNYRADIDGLRAIAVSVVILFHYGVPGFSGGFIGVDVFFVLSGYLIGSIILKQLTENRFSFITFYFRRVRRLFPVFAVVMLVTTVFAYLFMLPADFREYGQSLLASTVYLSNIFFYTEAGYFDTASHLKPLLHTWSLSVEEQFYIIFPFLAWLLFFINSRLSTLFFLLLTVVSFVAAQWLIGKDASAVFYLYPFRAWEMFLGVLLATVKRDAITSVVSLNIISLVGLVFVIYPVFIYDETTLFPAIGALLPCIGTVMLIYAGGQTSRVWLSGLLSKSIPSFIGKISYSLYLWHWPVYVLYSYHKIQALTSIDIVIMAISTFVLSVLSWKYVETPFRNGRYSLLSKKSFVFIGTLAVSVAFIGFGYYLHKSNGMPSRFDKQVVQFANVNLFGSFKGCHKKDNALVQDVAFCQVGEPFAADSYTLLWGDSHGAAYKSGYADALKNTNQNAVVAWSGGCPPVFDINKDESVASTTSDEQCAIRNDAIKSLINRDASKVSSVVLIGRWSYYIHGQGVGVDAHNKIDVWPRAGQPDSTQQGKIFIDAFNETVKYLVDAGIKVYVVEQAPEFPTYQARKVALGMVSGGSDFVKKLGSLTDQHYDNVVDRQQRMQDALLQSEEGGLLTILKTHHFFCQQKNCSVMLNGKPGYFDNNHISVTGAVAINEMFKPVVIHAERQAGKPSN